MGTITKALEMLDYFSRSWPELGLGDFVRLTGRDKATVHRHLVELAANGFLEQDAESRAYRLGPAILRLAGVRERTHPARSVLRPVVQALAEEVGELVHLSILQGEQLSPLVHSDPFAHGTRVHFDESEMLPLHATSSGIAVLAFADAGWAERIISGSLTRYTDRTETDPDRLRAVIAETRASGVAELGRSFDGEVVSQGVPVFGPDARVFGALSVAMPHVRANADRSRTIDAVLRRGCVTATRALGGHLPETLGDLWLSTT